MPSRRFSGERSGMRPFVVVLVLLIVAGLGYALWGALRLGPEPTIAIETDRPAIGADNHVKARFAEPARGLGEIKLELIQGTESVVLAEQKFPRASAFAPLPGERTRDAVLEAKVGRAAQSFLKEGEATLRASATRLAGPLRGLATVTVEKRVPVRLRPPRLELLSQQHYVRQGGAGMVVFRVGDSAVRSGVRAGEVESPSYPRPGGSGGDRFSLYALPWQDADPEIRLFAEDDAGNRAEIPFITRFKAMPPTTDRIELSGAFLGNVVPAIASQTAGFDASGSLLDQYLVINRELRKKNLAQVAALAEGSEADFLWSGAFLQMPNTQRFANFAQRRTYVFEGEPVDQQTHLGLDLASHAQAPVPAANSGRVVYADWLGIYGNAVVVDHGYGLMSLYGHLSSISANVGERVAKGQTIATSGATGLAGGDHLHLEVFLHGVSVDPVEWLDGKWIRDNLKTKLPEVPIE